MRSWPLTVDRIITHAERVWPAIEVVSRIGPGVSRRTSYATIAANARAVSRALAAAGSASATVSRHWRSTAIGIWSFGTGSAGWGPSASP